MSTSVINCSKKMSGSRYPKHTSLEQHDDESSSTKSSTFVNPAANAKGAKVAVLIDARASPSPRKNNYVQKQDQLNHLSKNPRLKQTDAVNGVTQEFPVSSCYKEAVINFGMSRSQHFFIKKNETELDLTPSIPIEGEDSTTTTTNGDAPTRKKKSTHYGTGQSSPRSNIIECAKELIIMESCSTKPNVLGNIKPVVREDEESFPTETETLSKDKLKLKLRRKGERRVGHSKGRTTRQHTSPALAVVAVEAARGKDAAVAVHVSDQERDTKSFTTIDCICIDLDLSTISTSKVEKEMACNSDQADGGARSARTPLPSSVWTSQEETLVAGKCLLEMDIRTDNISTATSVLVFVSTSSAQDQEQDQGKSQIMSDQDQMVASKLNMEERHDLQVNHGEDAVEQGAKEVVILMSVPLIAVTVTLNNVALAVMKKIFNLQELFATELASEETLRDAAAAHARTQPDARVAKMDSLDVNIVAGMENSLENENCSIARQSGSESRIKTIKKYQNSSSRCDDSQHGTAGIEGKVFPIGSLQAAAKEEPLGCHDGASFLSHRSKKNLVSIYIFFYKKY